MLVDESTLNRVESVDVAHSLHGLHGVAVYLHRQHQAGPNQPAIYPYCARTAHPVLTPQMCAGQSKVMTQGIGE
jgi:hypothetical protein